MKHATQIRATTAQLSVARNVATACVLAKINRNSLRDGKDFLAGFSNIGPQVDITGPGVDIVSTLPGGAYGATSGTSMATPAVTGFAAMLLAGDAGVQAANGAARSQKLKPLLYSKAKPESFGRDFNGFGLPQPSVRAILAGAARWAIVS